MITAIRTTLVVTTIAPTTTEGTLTVLTPTLLVIATALRMPTVMTIMARPIRAVATLTAHLKPVRILMVLRKRIQTPMGHRTLIVETLTVLLILRQIPVASTIPPITAASAHRTLIVEITTARTRRERRRRATMRATHRTLMDPAVTLPLLAIRPTARTLAQVLMIPTKTTTIPTLAHTIRGLVTPARTVRPTVTTTVLPTTRRRTHMGQTTTRNPGWVTSCAAVLKSSRAR